MEQSREVLHKIRVYGAVSIALAAIAVAVLVGRQVQQVVLAGAGNVVASTSSALVESCLDYESGLPFTPESLNRLETLVAERSTDDSRMLIRVMDINGSVIFSTMPEEVGETPEEVEFDASVRGETHVGVVDTAGNAALADVHDTQALEVLTPLVVPGTGEIIGVVETYKPYAEVATSVRDAVLVVWVPVGVGAIVSYLGLLWVLAGASRQLAVHEKEKASLSARLHDSFLSLEGQSLGTLQALSAAVDEKDSYTARHSLGVTGWAHHIGTAAGLSSEDLATLERAGLLHDIGKIGVPESVLLKPGALSEIEFELIKQHPDAGARILEAIPFLDTVVPVVRFHHERWDGKGYPTGLAGEEIPYLARVLAVADAFDAMTTDRPYRKAMSVEDASREIESCAGAQFDPEIARVFLSNCVSLSV
ncbi:MAG: HD-GYP domain-containing protein [Actinomycetota bacterium]|nr:HD-GYP domain-containing protein [Actinomycetota bacterium]MDP3629478.1 HD-GYP domain-containing protein [Actinomycetota bacterium]